MIDIALADRFIKKAANYTQQNINVMDENGIIIASSDSERVGSFHEIAYNIMSSDKELIEVSKSDGFQGGRSGINMALIYKKHKLGVVGVSGEPEEIRSMALLIKMALETMLEYEMQSKMNYQKQSLRTRFVDGLLYQEEPDAEGELSAVSEQLGIIPTLLRIPILICFENQADGEKLLELLRKKNLFRLQDICAVTRNNSIIIFKSFREQENVFEQYKLLLQEPLEALTEFFSEAGVSCRFFIGSFQREYRYYGKSFYHCGWLKKYCRDSEETIHYFYDHVGDYMRDVMPMIELNRIYEVLCGRLDEETKNSMIEMITVLHRNNYNLNESSRELFIHKNTLIFRYNKVKNLFHINPIQSMPDREFLSWLVLYLRKNR